MAGIGNENYEMTSDNMESTFQLNYLSYFLLTNLFLPRIKATAAKKEDGPCQIVNTASISQYAGEVATNIYDSLRVFGRIIKSILKLGRTADEAANAILLPVLCPEVGVKCGGEYFGNGKVKPPNHQVN
ncbi:unnamed protein product [Orchesella dallaii]|uniref:Uncharacterized protein n=1 Tax=Orchesella dallaii TaxID=48710 RepID=A0ABP1RRF8_9HEXA